MPVKSVKYSFTAGELDPTMYARADIEYYYSAAQSLSNCLVLPQGGAKKRPGLEYLDRLHRQVTQEAAPTITAPNGGTTANANDNSTASQFTTTTNISTTNNYVVAQYDLGSSKNIAFVDILDYLLTVSGTSTEFQLQGSNNGSSWTAIQTGISLSTTAASKRFRVRASYRYIRFVRVGTTDLSTNKAQFSELNVFVESSTLSESRIVDFAFNTEQTYELVFTDQNIAVYKDGVFQVDVRASDFTSSKLANINWTQSADTAIFVHEDIQPSILQRQGSDTNWSFNKIAFDFIPKYDFVPVKTNPAVTLTPSAIDGTVTLTAGAAAFSAGSANQYIDGNGGRARIVKYVSTTVVEAFVEIPFYNTNAIASGDWTYQAGFEDVWSTSKGWPKSVTFHESRLWFGGSKSRPHTLWGSRVGWFYDFDIGTLLDDDAIDVTLDTDQVNSILNLFSQRTLQIFTSGGEFVIFQNSFEPITPTNIAIKRQTQDGSKAGIRPVENEGRTLFVQKNGKMILGFIFNDIEQSYKNDKVSLFSSHLIKTPVDAAMRKSSSTEEANYYILVNNDGTLAVATLLPSQDVTAFTPQVTDGKFKNVGVDNEKMYFVVERTISGVATRYFERFNSSFNLDCSKMITTGLPANVFTGLDYIEDKACKVIADGSLLADNTVDNGQVTIERNAETYVEIGLNFTPYIKLLPFEDVKYGSLMGKKKRIVEAILKLKDTKSIKVNDNIVSFRKFGLAGAGSPLDSPPPSFTGDKKVQSILGWDDYAQLEMTQDEPLDFTVLGVALVVSF